MAENYDAESLSGQPVQPLSSSQPSEVQGAGGVAADGYSQYLSEESEPNPSLVRGLIWSVILAFLAAIVYILPILVAKREFVILAVLIGFAAAFGFTVFGQVKGLVAGLLSAAVAAVGFFTALALTVAVQLASYPSYNIFTGFGEAVKNIDLTIKLYFEGDAMSWVIFAVAVIAGFWFASGLGKSDDDDDAAAPVAVEGTPGQPS